MYEAYFQLDKKPFEQTPDSEFIYLSEQHGHALASMKFAIAGRDALVIINGEIESGKIALMSDFVVTRISDTQLMDTGLL